MGFALLEQIAHSARADSDEHLDKIGSRHREKWSPGFTSDRARQQSLAGAGWSDEQRTLGQASAKLGELLRIFQELDDLLKLDLRFVGSSDVVKGDFGGVASEKLCLRFAKAERLRSAGLHRSEQEEPDSEDEQVRKEADQNSRERRTSILRLNLHAVVAESRDFVARVFRRQKNLEFRDEAPLHRHLLLELPCEKSAGLASHLTNVVLLQLLIVL